MDKLQIYNH